MAPTPDEIEAARTPAGGWTREKLAEWGVPWPPPKGWRRQLTRQDELGNEIAGKGHATAPPTEATETSTLFDVDRNTPLTSSPRSSTGGVDIFTDGACSGNPGPGGWGAVLRYGRHEKTIYGGEPADTTNNRMELLAG